MGRASVYNPLTAARDIPALTLDYPAVGIHKGQNIFFEGKLTSPVMGPKVLSIAACHLPSPDMPMTS